MLYEQYTPQDLLTPSFNDDGVHKLQSSLTSLDFYLLDDIDLYLDSIPSTKQVNDDLFNNSLHDNSQHQEDFFSDIVIDDLKPLDERSGPFTETTLLEDIDIEKWISESYFPSPQMDTNTSSPSSSEDPSSVLTWTNDSSPISTDMIVPQSPSLSSTDSSSTLPTKRQKLSAIERKLRKKDQNKTAAEKYRIRKKSERHQLIDRHLKLQETNRTLKLELEDLTYRVEKFKQLFIDLLHINPSISI